jgi:6-phosphofructokinase 1
MGGKTELVVSMLQDYYIYLPLALVTRKRRRLKPQSNFWSAVLESTGQPFNLCNE